MGDLLREIPGANRAAPAGTGRGGEVGWTADCRLHICVYADAGKGHSTMLDARGAVLHLAAIRAGCELGRVLHRDTLTPRIRWSATRSSLTRYLDTSGQPPGWIHPHDDRHRDDERTDGHCVGAARGRDRGPAMALAGLRYPRSSGSPPRSTPTRKTYATRSRVLIDEGITPPIPQSAPVDAERRARPPARASSCRSPPSPARAVPGPDPLRPPVPGQVRRDPHGSGGRPPRRPSGWSRPASRRLAGAPWIFPELLAAGRSVTLLGDRPPTRWAEPEEK